MWQSVLTAAVLGFVAAVAAAGFPPNVAEALRTSSYIYVATRRADGSQANVVPVWFTVDADAIYFTSAPESYKVKRIRKGSPLLVWVGSRTGPHFEGKAELLQDPALADRMGKAYNQKYWIAWLGFFRPRADRVGSGKTVIVKVTPPPAAS
jgi:PPOX class probable F420-dependent enzyme